MENLPFFQRILATVKNYLPTIKVTPKSLQMIPTKESIVKEYIFPQLPANDYKLFEITTNNAVLYDKEGRLMLKPLDNEPIDMQFKTERTWTALVVTIMAWCAVIGFMLTQTVMNRKKN